MPCRKLLSPDKFRFCNTFCILVVRTSYRKLNRYAHGFKVKTMKELLHLTKKRTHAQGLQPKSTRPEKMSLSRMSISICVEDYRNTKAMYRISSVFSTPFPFA